MVWMADIPHMYVDDVLIYSKTWEEHKKHIEEVLGKLRKAGLTVNMSKCEWDKQQLEYLGHRVANGVVEVPEARVRSIVEYR